MLVVSRPSIGAPVWLQAARRTLIIAAMHARAIVPLTRGRAFSTDISITPKDSNVARNAVRLRDGERGQNRGGRSRREAPSPAGAVSAEIANRDDFAAGGTISPD